MDSSLDLGAIIDELATAMESNPEDSAVDEILQNLPRASDASQDPEDDLVKDIGQHHRDGIGKRYEAKNKATPNADSVAAEFVKINTLVASSAEKKLKEESPATTVGVGISATDKDEAMALATADDEILRKKCSSSEVPPPPEDDPEVLPTPVNPSSTVGAIAVFNSDGPQSTNDGASAVAGTALVDAIAQADEENLVQAHLVEEEEEEQPRQEKKSSLTVKHLFVLVIIIGAVLLAVILTRPFPSGHESPGMVMTVEESLPDYPRSANQTTAAPSYSYTEGLQIGVLAGLPGDQYGDPLAMSAGGISIGSGADGIIQVFQPAFETQTTIDLLDQNNPTGPSPKLLDMALSARGSRLVVGVGQTIKTNSSGEELPQAGQLRVFDLARDRRSWAQQETSLDGMAVGDFFGSDVAISADGRIVAGSSVHHNQTTGSLRVFRECDSCATGWEQMGSTLMGQESQDQFGASIALAASGMRIAAGAPQSAVSGLGYVQVFDFNGSEWNQVGDTVWGESENEGFGSVLALSKDGVLACASPQANYRTGLVRTFQLEKSPNSDDDGHIWEHGETMHGITNGDEFGTSVSLAADGGRLAVGATQELADSGYVRVFDFYPTNNKWSQIGRDLEGTWIGDKFGFSNLLSADGLTLAVGAIGGGADGDNSGEVRVFDLGQL